MPVASHKDIHNPCPVISLFPLWTFGWEHLPISQACSFHRFPPHVHPTVFTLPWIVEKKWRALHSHPRERAGVSLLVSHSMQTSRAYVPVLLQELKDLSNDPPANCSAGPHTQDDMFTWKVRHAHHSCFAPTPP